MALLGNIRNVADRAIRAVAPNFVTPNPVIDDAASVIGNPGGVAFRRYAPALFDRGVRGLGQDVMRDAGRVNDMAQSGLSGLRSVGRRVGAAVMGGRQGLAELDRGRVNGMPTPVETLPPASTPTGRTSILGGLVRGIGDSAIPQAPGAIPGALPRPVGMRYPGMAPASPRTGVFYHGAELGRDASGGIVTDPQAVDDQNLQWHDIGQGASATNATAVTRDAQGNVVRRGFADPRVSIAQRRLGVGSVTPQGGIITGATVGDMDRSSTPLSALPDARARIGFGNMRMTGPTFVTRPLRQERLLGLQGDQALALARENNASAERVAGANNDRQLGLKRAEWKHDLELQDRKNQGLKDANGHFETDADTGEQVWVAGRDTTRGQTGTTAGDANIYKTTMAGIDTRLQELIRQRGVAEKNASGWFPSDDAKQAVADIDAQLAELNDQEKALLETQSSPAPRAGIRTQAKSESKQKTGKPLTMADAEALYKETGGDHRKALELARQRGFTI